MNTLRSRLPVVLAVAAALTVTLASTGCGLKGALSLPSQSEEIVIRPAPGTTTSEDVTPPTGEAPATTPEPKKTPPKDERLPPPPLPGGNSGTARGG